MNYELAKKLKDAGFPFRACENLYCESEWVKFNGDSFHSPTLSELIEACGDEFYSLTKLFDQWEAVGYENIHELKFPTLACRYSTPEEAVANLWLELNKKEKV